MNEKGFTLMELLVVIAIIACVTAIVLLAINPSRMFNKNVELSEKDQCDLYKNYRIDELPAYCVKYYIPDNNCKK